MKLITKTLVSQILVLAPLFFTGCQNPNGASTQPIATAQKWQPDINKKAEVDFYEKKYVRQRGKWYHYQYSADSIVKELYIKYRSIDTVYIFYKVRIIGSGYCDSVYDTAIGNVDSDPEYDLDGNDPYYSTSYHTIGNNCDLEIRVEEDTVYRVQVFASHCFEKNIDDEQYDRQVLRFSGFVDTIRP